MISPASSMAMIAAGLLIASAYILVRRRTGSRPDEALLAACLLACLEAVAAVQVLGWTGFLSPSAVRLAAAAFLGLHLGLAARHSRTSLIGRIRPIPRWLVPAFAVAGVTLFARLLLAALAPPDGWDALGYHLPFAARWARQGGLDLAGWPGQHRWFAWNGELLAAWLALLDGGRLVSAKLVQILGLPIMAAAGSSLGRRLAGARWAAACGLAAAALPIGIIQSGMAYVDLLYAAFWTAAVAAAVAWARTAKAVHLLAFGAAAGLALGTKSTFFFLLPLLLPPAAALVRHPALRRTTARLLAPASLLALVAGAGSYVRNLLLTGNPIYPIGLTLAGRRIFGGIVSAADFPAAYEGWYVSSPWGWLLYPFKETVRGVWGYTHLNGFGPLFAAGWLLFALSLGAAWKRRDAVTTAYISLFPAVLVLFFALQPVRIPRYIIFLAPLPIMALAAAIRRARGKTLVAARWAFSLLLAAGCAGVWVYLARQPGYRWMVRAALSGEKITAAGYYAAQYGSLGHAWAALDAALQPGESVAVNEAELSLPWAGTPPRAAVHYVRLGRSPYPDALAADSESGWLEMLEKVGARWLVVWSPAWTPENGRRDRAAALAHPDRFELFARTSSPAYGQVEIFRVLLIPGHPQAGLE